MKRKKLEDILLSMETKVERVKCGTEAYCIKDAECFGWTFSSKRLLNKFGNPLPSNHGLSKEELLAKCYYDIQFVRDVDINLVKELSNLEDKYISLRIINATSSRFGKGRIFAIVVCSIVTTAAFGVLFSSKGNFDSPSFIATIIVGLLGLAGLLSLIFTGVYQVKKTNSLQFDAEQERKRIKSKAKALLDQHK